MSLVTPLIEVFKYALEPIAPFTWFGLGISTLDVIAAFRICIVLRQIKEILHLQHAGVPGSIPVEKKSFMKNLSTTLTVVFGGEAMTGPMLGVPPSFMLSGTVTGLYTAVQAIVELLPVVPSPSIHTELPLSIVDGFTRALLLCSLIPPSVTTNASQIISSSPWTLLLTSLITANGGFFLTNMLSFLHPTPLALQTPPELQPYGWTTTDLWCAPLITGLYALLTHAQPFWAEAHVFIINLMGGSVDFGRGHEKEVAPVDPEVARAVCAAVLSILFAARTVKNFSGPTMPSLEGAREQRSKKTLKRNGKAKTQ